MKKRKSKYNRDRGRGNSPKKGGPLRGRWGFLWKKKKDEENTMNGERTTRHGGRGRTREN